MSLQHRISSYKGRLSQVSVRTAAWQVKSERLERLLEVERTLVSLLRRVKKEHPSYVPLNELRAVVGLQAKKLNKSLADYQSAKENWNQASEDARDRVLTYTDKIHLWKQLSAVMMSSPNEVDAVDNAMIALGHSAVENF